MGRRPLTNLLWVALCLGAAAASNGSGEASHTRSVDREAAAGSTKPVRLRRRRAATQTRQTQDVHFGEDLQEGGKASDAQQLGGQNLCKSIIAVGGWRAPGASNTERWLQGNGEGEFADEDAEGSGRALARRDKQPRIDFGNGDEGDIAFIENDNVVIPFKDEELVEIDTDEEFVCELEDGSTLPIQGTQAQITELRTLLNNGTLISAQLSVEAERIDTGVSGGSGMEGIAAMPGDADSLPEFVALPPGLIRVIDNKEDEYSRRRRLNRYKGVKKILVVKVKDNVGRAVPENAAVISDKWFGTSGDQVTPTSGFRDCSFGEMTISNDYGGAFDESLLSAPGVLEVDVDIDLRSSTQSAIRNKAAVAVQEKLQLRLPGPFDHVAFVVERCYGSGCGYQAYAFVQHWFSLYVKSNWKYPAVVMHEIGHNLNFAHSGGLNGRTYTDHTCLMGNPLWKDDVGKMCYNPVKQYQLAMAGNSWYSAEHTQVFDSGTVGGTSWAGRIIGVAEYDNNPADHPVVLKLETGKGRDFFLGLNRAVGPNAHSQQANDRVTLYTVAAGDGSKYSNSFLKAGLRGLQRATIKDWRDTGEDLVINVYAINTSASPGYADVEIAFGPQPTPSPSQSPTKSTASPTVGPTIGPTNLPTTAPTTSPTAVPTKTTGAPTSSGVAFFDSGAEGGTSWVGALVGIGASPSQFPHTLVLKYDDDTRWFVQYDGATHVTVFRWSDGDVSLEATLSTGQNKTVLNWRDSTFDLIIGVQEVDDNASPLVAHVQIAFGPQPTSPPTMSPTVESMSMDYESMSMSINYLV